MQSEGSWKISKYELRQHTAFNRWRNWYELQSRLPKAQIYFSDLWNFAATLGPRVSEQSASKVWIHPRRHSKGSVIASAEELSYTKGEVWLNHNFSDSHQGFSKAQSCAIWRGWCSPGATRNTVISTICFALAVARKEPARGKRRQCGLTGVGPEVSCEGVPPSAGVAAEGTFERFLPRVQLDVPQQVPLLGKRSSTLVAVEGAFTWKGKWKGERCQETPEGAHCPTLCSTVISHRSARTATITPFLLLCALCKAASSNMGLFPLHSISLRWSLPSDFHEVPNLRGFVFSKWWALLKI